MYLAALEGHLQGTTEKLRSGVNGKVRETTEQTIDRIVVGMDGTLTLETKPDGLLGLEGPSTPPRGFPEEACTWAIRPIHIRQAMESNGSVVRLARALPPNSRPCLSAG